jgi:2-succinyl-6-hydroxy-2,4-cyclohexadiene-1-carboxylate synthase
MPEAIVLLHGFSATHRAWDGVVAALDTERYLPLALDLPGHGAAAEAEWPITFQSCVQSVLAQAPERFVLCGYSLGGRVALHIALQAPERVSRLLLVSCSAGIDDPVERAERRASDLRLAEDLETMPFEEFIERWRTQPLFATEPPAVGRQARADQRRNRPEALAGVMRGLGTGEMQPLWSRLGELQMPTTVIVGERDAKFRSLGERMVASLSHAELLVVAGAHGLLLENPRSIAQAID